MELTQKQIEIEAQNYLNGLDLPENADKQLILDNFKNGMAWAMMLLNEEKQQQIITMDDKKHPFYEEIRNEHNQYELKYKMHEHYIRNETFLQCYHWLRNNINNFSKENTHELLNKFFIDNKPN